MQLEGPSQGTGPRGWGRSVTRPRAADRGNVQILGQQTASQPESQVMEPSSPCVSSEACWGGLSGARPLQGEPRSDPRPVHCAFVLAASRQNRTPTPLPESAAEPPVPSLHGCPAPCSAPPRHCQGRLHPLGTRFALLSTPWRESPEPPAFPGCRVGLGEQRVTVSNSRWLPGCGDRGAGGRGLSGVQQQPARGRRQARGGDRKPFLSETPGSK